MAAAIMLTKVIKNCYYAGSAKGHKVVINTGGLPNTGLTVLTPLLFMTVTTGPNNSSNSKC